MKGEPIMLAALVASVLYWTPGVAQGSLPPGAEARSLLGQPLVPAPLPPAVRQTYEQRLAEALRGYEHTPNNADSIIWLGRRTAYLGRYREAIAIFGEGIRKHAKDARMYRHRGHRYITVREFDRAITDLEKADRLERYQPDSVEPDGLPNARGIPTSTLQSNIRYHLGLAYYLEGRFDKAAELYQRDVAAARATGNADMLVASSHWLYMALRRLGRRAEAGQVLEPITGQLQVIENGVYRDLLLMYKEGAGGGSQAAGDSGSVEDVTRAYGVGNWHLYNGRREQAFAIFRKILESPQWGAFGYIAAEAELARTRQTRLPNLRVSARTPCEVHPETAAATADLWLAARQTLESAARQAEAAPTLLVQEWRRTLDGRFRLRWERRDTSFVRTLHPFEKPLPGNVERAGYIQQRGWTTFFYGPDAGLLVSEWFLRRHCFTRISGTGAAAGLEGLAFTPLPSTRHTDVAGVLWVDAARGELRHVEYAWTSAPDEARAASVGGRTDFVRLKSGGWIVQRWNIRMPRLEAGLGHGFDGYTDQGGEVLAVSEAKRPRR